MKNGLICVLGGSGFLGRQVVAALAARDDRIRVGVRRPDLAVDLQPLGRPGQIAAVQANVRFPASLAAACAGADVVVNLVGILHERGAQTFDAIHVHGAGAVARAAREAGARRLIHVSAIGAERTSTSDYARTKALGEEAVMREFADACIVRPSVVFGVGDDFFNRFAAMARLSPVLPLVGGGRTRFQPVFVGDVGDAIARLADGAGQPATVYEFGGPEILTMRQVMELVLEITDRRRLLLPVPFSLASIIALLTQWLPNPPLTPDQVALLRHDNIVSQSAEDEGRTLAGLGVVARAVEAIVPAYLYRYRRFGQYTGVWDRGV